MAVIGEEENKSIHIRLLGRRADVTNQMTSFFRPSSLPSQGT